MRYFAFAVALSAALAGIAYGAEVVVEQKMAEMMKAQVLEILSTEDQPIYAASATQQTLRAEILSGTEKGAVVTAKGDYLHLKVGDIFYLVHRIEPLEGIDVYYVSDPDRMSMLYIVGALFMLCLVLFGGWQGIRGFVSLVASILVIFYLFLPGILNGYSPALLSIGIASLIILVGSYVTHGFTKTTTSAVIGMLGTVTITGLLAYWSVDAGRLTGFTSDETVYLSYGSQGGLDLVGLLLGGMLIGLLGVLYDSAIGQAVAVEELHRIGPHVPRWTVYKRALRIGREHIGALVNTLAIAYVGASLPLLLLFSQYVTPSSVITTVNREIFASEILRILIGSIGLILAVPITTLVAVLILIKRTPANRQVVQQEEKKIEEFEHRH